MEVIAILVGGAVLFAVIQLAVNNPGRRLQRAFVQMGDMTGMTRSSIEDKVGAPNSISAIGGGQIVCQWMATGYHIALIFGPDGVFQGVSHEHAA